MITERGRGGGRDSGFGGFERLKQKKVGRRICEVRREGGRTVGSRLKTCVCGLGKEGVTYRGTACMIVNDGMIEKYKMAVGRASMHFIATIQR